MSNTLTILEVGVVGITPRILFLDTSEDEAAVFAAGFLNELAETSIIQIQKGDFLLIRFDNGTLQEIASPQFGANGVITLLPIAGDINTGGPITGGLNVGGGDEVFKDVAAGLMRFRTLIAGANITLTENADDVTIAAANPGLGTITDGQNLGVGDGVFAQASGADLQFKTLIAGANISLTPTLTDITIAGLGGGGGTITGGVNLGGGNDIFNSAAGANLQFNTLVSGANVTIIPAGDTLVISASGGGGGGDVTDGVNLGAGTHVFAQKSGTNLQFKTLVAGPNISLSNDANTVTLTGIGGGGGFIYAQTMFVAKGGNDANPGTSESEPKLTIQAAINSFVSPTAQNVINILDAGTYTQDLVFPSGSNMKIIAPGATLAAVAGPHFALVNGSRLVVECYEISSSFHEILSSTNSCIFMLEAKFVFGNFTINSAQVILNAKELAGNIAVNNASAFEANTFSIAGNASITGTANFQLKFDSMTGNVVDTSAASLFPDVGLFGSLITGNVSSTNSNLYGEVAKITGTRSGVKFGNFGPSAITVPFGTQNGILAGGGVEISNSSVKGEIFNIAPILNGLADYTITAADANNVIGIYAPTANIFINLPDYITDPNIPVGFKCYILQAYAGSGRIQTMGVDLFESPDNNKEWTMGRGAFVQVELIVKAAAGNLFQNIWGATGDLAGSAFNQYAGPNFYVTKLFGNDLTGNGSITAPFASIGAAQTFIGVPANKVNIVIIDDEIYDESLTFANSLINILGPQASLESSTGDTLTITAATGSMQVFLGELGCDFGGGKALNYVGAGIVNVNAETMYAPIVSSNANIYLNANAIASDLTVTGAPGTINYRSDYYTGVQTPGPGNIRGLTPIGVTGPFTIPGTLVATGLTYPLVDGAAGDVVTTDGVGNLTLQAPAAGGTAWFGVAGVAQAAAVNSGYVIQNAAVTTVTLPAIAPLGSIVAVAGLGAGGWALQANGGQVIHAGAVASSAGGSVNSVNRYDEIEVVCLVANTTWGMRSAVTTGFIVL